ncbi:MAG: hypothetical protein WKH64_12545 [Chloroflexia bacterium]
MAGRPLHAVGGERPTRPDPKRFYEEHGVAAVVRGLRASFEQKTFPASLGFIESGFLLRGGFPEWQG